MNRIATATFKLAWSGLAVWAAWSLTATAGATAVEIVAMDIFVVVAWAIVMLQPGAVRGAVYAIAWGWIIVALVGGLLAVAAPDGGPGWTIAAIALASGLWIFVLLKKISLFWPVGVAVALVTLMMPLGTLAVGVITTIGLGKLIIEMMGRRNVLAGSRLSSGPTIIPPKGMVEYKSYES